MTTPDAPRVVDRSETSAGAGVLKRSLVVAGHRTSISLEDAFWRALKTLAKRRSQSVNALVAEIDVNRGQANLSSAIRVYLFQSAIQ
jgi:predicted DNA-binding ribbon-helix-helix protein